MTLQSLSQLTKRTTKLNNDAAAAAAAATATAATTAAATTAAATTAAATTAAANDYKELFFVSKLIQKAIL